MYTSKKNKRTVMMIIGVVLLMAFAALSTLASSGPPTNTTATDLEWDGSNWTFRATNDTFCDGAPTAGPCEKVCLEIALNDGAGNRSNFTRINHTTTGDPDDNSNQTEFTFVVTPPAWALNVASPASVDYQFYMINQSATNCPNPETSSYFFTGWIPGFQTGPTAVTLSTFSANAALPLLLFVVVGLLLGGTALLTRRR